MGLRDYRLSKKQLKKWGNHMKKHLLPIGLMTISVMVWLIFYPSLPDQVPIHWSSGEGADGYQSKGMAFITLHAFMIGIYLLLTVVPKIDPKKKNYQYFSKAYSITILSTMVLFFLINMFILLISLGYDIPMESIGGPLVGLLFLIMGNYMQQAKQNFFFGIRTPWTLMDETIWRKTHRLGGKLFMVGGIIMMLTLFLPASYEIFIILSVVVLVAVVPTGYSYILFRKLDSQS